MTEMHSKPSEAAASAAAQEPSCQASVSQVLPPCNRRLVLCVKESDDNGLWFIWDNINDDKHIYEFQLFRRNQGGAWEPRSTWDGKQKIRVLNVYPPNGNHLEEWLNKPVGPDGEPAGKGFFVVVSVPIDDFNKDPEGHLGSKKDGWKHDVIFFGASDANSGKDLSPEAFVVVNDFICDGRGVLFGHDTVWTAAPNFGRFAPRLGIKIVIKPKHMPTKTAEVIKNGTLTCFPWKLSGKLEIPECHCSGQFVGGTLKATEWMTLIHPTEERPYDDETKSHSEFYLAVFLNVGMIQTGHSCGEATPHECMVLANVLFHIFQVSVVPSAREPFFDDITPPDQPEVSVKLLDDGRLELDAKSKGNSTTYDYCIVAKPKHEEGDMFSSNIVSKTIKSELAGFLVCFSDSDQSARDQIMFDPSHEHVLGLYPADDDGHALIKIKPEGKFLHMFAVDRVDNISEEYVAKVPFEEPKVNETKVDELKIDEPKDDEPKVDELNVDEPKVDEPKVDEPKMDEFKLEEPEQVDDKSEESDSDSDSDDELDPMKCYCRMLKAQAKYYKSLAKHAAAGKCPQSYGMPMPIPVNFFYKGSHTHINQNQFGFPGC